jgi:hypothetical protein
VEQDKQSKKKRKNRSKKKKNSGQPDTAKSLVLMLYVHETLSAPVLACDFQVASGHSEPVTAVAKILLLSVAIMQSNHPGV